MQLLKKADFNILDFDYRIEEIPWRENSSVSIKHEDVRFLNASDEGKFYLDDSSQSKGTKRFLMILDFLYDMVTGNHVYMMDELDVELHYDLLLYFLNVFLYNSYESQLIFTSASKFTRADQFGLHKNLSLFRSYKIGKLGAVPSLGSFLVDLNEEEED